MTKQELQKAIHESYPVRMLVGPYAVDTNANGISEVSERVERGSDKSLITISISFTADRHPDEIAYEREQDALRRKYSRYMPFSGAH